MEALGYLAVAAVAVASTLVGVRLLLTAKRTRGLPEAVLGGSLVAITGLGFPIILLTELRATIGPVATFAADALGSSLVAAGFCGFYVFTWRVFRPTARWAAVLAILGSAAVWVAMAATVWVAIGIESSEEKFAAVRAWEILVFAGAAAGFVWNTIDTTAYWLRMRRRLRLGLADAVVTNRFLLWALTGASAAGALVTLMCLRLADVNYMQAPVALFTAAACGLLVSVFLYLAFLPPPAYLAAVKRRAASSRHD